MTERGRKGHGRDGKNVMGEKTAERACSKKESVRVGLLGCRAERKSDC